MKQYQISYKDEDALHEKLAVIKFLSEKSQYSDVIFYLTWTKSAQADVETVTRAIMDFFPDAPYYGNEASGNIAMGRFTYGMKT